MMAHNSLMLLYIRSISLLLHLVGRDQQVHFNNMTSFHS